MKKELYLNAEINEVAVKFEADVAAINAAIKSEKSSAEVDKAIADSKETLKKLNGLCRDAASAVLRAKENPMLALIEELVYEAFTLKRVTDSETKAVSYVSASKEVRFDCARLEDFCKTQIGAKAGWRYRADDFARYLATRKAKEIGADWQSVAANFKLRTHTERTAIKDPTSMNNLIERLQELVDAMYFAPYVDKDGNVDASKNLYKVTSKDVAFVLGRAYGDSKKLLTVGTLKKPMDDMLRIAVEVLNHLVFGNAYNVEYKAQ